MGIINQIESMSPLVEADLATYSFIIIRGTARVASAAKPPTFCLERFTFIHHHANSYKLFYSPYQPLRFASAKMNFDVFPTIGGWGHRHNSKTRSLPVIGLNLDVRLGLFLPLFRSAMAIFCFNVTVEIER